MFADYMSELGIQPPVDVPTLKGMSDWFKERQGTKESKGRSTLSKYVCECGQNIRVGKKKWPGAICNNCGSQYQREVSVGHIVYQDKAPKDEQPSWVRTYVS